MLAWPGSNTCLTDKKYENLSKNFLGEIEKFIEREKKKGRKIGTCVGFY